jgi:hypothetical protein
MPELPEKTDSENCVERGSSRSQRTPSGDVSAGLSRPENRWYYLGGRQPVEPTEPKLPSKAIELYNDFIHGEISRRAFMEGVQRLAGGLVAVTVINALMKAAVEACGLSRVNHALGPHSETSRWNGSGTIIARMARAQMLRLVLQCVLPLDFGR